MPLGPVHPSLSLPIQLQPGIPPQTAQILSLIFTSTYVGSLYLAQQFITRPQKTLNVSLRNKVDGNTAPAPTPPPIAASGTEDVVLLNGAKVGPEVGTRDHPDTIRVRIKAVNIASIGSIGGVWWVVKSVGGYSAFSALYVTTRLLGLTLPRVGLGNLALCFLLTPTLLAGPIYAMMLDGDLPFQNGQGGLWMRMRKTWEGMGWIEYRNYLAGPITEELVFRSTLISISLLAKQSIRHLVFVTPLWFGVAHSHHAVEVWKKGGRSMKSAGVVLAGCAFQLTYTTLFGWFASYLFIRTGSVIPPLVSHIFCNLMGIYLPTTAVQRHPERKLSVCGAYLAGIIGFTLGVRRL